MSHDEEELWLRRALKRKTLWLYTRLMMANAETNWISFTYVLVVNDEQTNEMQHSTRGSLKMELSYWENTQMEGR